MNTLGTIEGRKQILHRIVQLSRNDQRRWGSMSAHEMICHLSDSFRIPLGEKRASPATGLLRRTALKWLALWLPVKWAKGFPTRPEVEQGKGGSPPADFDCDKEALLELVGRFCDRLAQLSAPHPVFGHMNAKEWARWGYLHTDHHLRQFAR